MRMLPLHLEGRTKESQDTERGMRQTEKELPQMILEIGAGEKSRDPGA